MGLGAVYASGSVGGTGVTILRIGNRFVLRWADGDQRAIHAEDAELFAAVLRRRAS